MTAIGSVMAVGLAAGTAAPAQASVGFYDVRSSWYQSFAALTATGDSGTFQAHAYLGNSHRWGRKSPYNTKAEVSGFNFTHNAILLRNGSVWKRAQG